MNPVLDCIHNRRSVRFYESSPIPKEILDMILKAGQTAPSGSNAQAWRFVAVTLEAARKKLAALALPRYQAWLKSAPEQFKAIRKVIDDAHTDPVFYSAPAILFIIGRDANSDYDCPMVCENIMLAARSLGLGSCWTLFGRLVLEDQEARDLLELKEGEKVYGPLVLGYPKGDFPAAPAKKAPEVKWV